MRPNWVLAMMACASKLCLVADEMDSACDDLSRRKPYVMFRIVEADTEEAVNEARALIMEYAAALGMDLSFQGFEKEMAEFPGEYASPDGRLLLAYKEASCAATRGLAGCVALRKVDSDTCEMKRLYVRREFRGQGAGRALALAVIGIARGIGYRRMRLDTLPIMEEAQALYGSLGFREIPPYRFNPIPGAVFLELTLTDTVLS